MAKNVLTGVIILVLLGLLITAASAEELKHWANKDKEWTTGCLGTQNSQYSESDSIPYRFEYEDLPANSCIYLDIHYMFYKNTPPPYGFDFLTSYNATDASNLFDGTNNSPYLNPDNLNLMAFEIPDDPDVPYDDAYRNMNGPQYIAIATNSDHLSVEQDGSYAIDSGDKILRIKITIGATTDDSNDLMVAWGGHLAIGNTANWGPGNGASAFPGGCLHSSGTSGDVDIFCDGIIDYDFNLGDLAIKSDLIEPATSDLGLKKDDDPDPAVVGSPFTYIINATNYGPDPVENAVIVDHFPPGLDNITWTSVITGQGSAVPASGTGDVYSVVNLSAGSSIVITATCIVNETVGCTLYNLANITAPEGTVDPIYLPYHPNSDGSNTSVDRAASIIVNKVANVTGPVYPGDVIEYNISVCNTGKSTVTILDVIDTLIGNIDMPDTSLSPGECTFTLVNHTVMEAEVCSELENRVTVNAEAACNVKASDTHYVALPTKSGALVNITTVANVTSATVGDSVEYNITVCNTGPSTVTLVDVTDDVLGDLTSYFTSKYVEDPVVLSPAECVFVRVNHTVEETAIGTLKNTVIVNGTDMGEAPVTDTATESVTISSGAAIDITKVANVTSVVPGDWVQYTITVCNTGKSTLTINDVIDTILGPLTMPNLNLSPEDCTFTQVEYQVPSDAVPGDLVNIVRVNTTDPKNNPVSDEATETITIASPGCGNITGKKGKGSCCPLEGFEISLINSFTGEVYATDVTGADGLFAFTCVPYGTYWLNETSTVLGWKQVTPNVLVTINATSPDFYYLFINEKDESCCVCPPTASFSYVMNGHEVQFTDTSTGPRAVRYLWLFGDGTMSTSEDPVKVYKLPGTYTVNLYITWVDCDGITYTWTSASQRIRVP